MSESATEPVRRMSAAEVHLAVDWARQEGWNPGLSDAATFYAADPSGFFVLPHEGAPAATISVVRYGDAYAFVGFYICRPDLRGRGLGTRVWAEALRHAEGRTVGLDAVDQQHDTYARLGYERAWRTYRFAGRGHAGPPPAGLVDLDTLPFAAIAAYDHDVFEADRRRFLRAWVAQPDAVRLGVLRDGALAGWGLRRPCAEGHKIGPLVADDAEAAERLLDGLLTAPAEPVYVDVPEPNEPAMRAAKARDMTPVFRTSRMYLGPRPPLNLGKVWGITSFELG